MTDHLPHEIDISDTPWGIIRVSANDRLAAKVGAEAICDFFRRGRITAQDKLKDMSLRTHLASMAMQGLLSNPDPQIASWDTRTIATNAVISADLLIAELQKPPTPTKEAP